MTACRGVRGATTAEANSSEAVVSATKELLDELVAANGLRPEDIATVIFTTTPDIDADFPAKATRGMGWQDVALLGAQEIGVAGAPPLCIRVLILWNTRRPQSEIKHVYLRGAKVLRPDRAK